MYNQNIKTNYRKEEIFEGILFYHEFIYPCQKTESLLSLHKHIVDLKP